MGDKFVTLAVGLIGAGCIAATLGLIYGIVVVVKWAWFG